MQEGIRHRIKCRNAGKQASQDSTTLYPPEYRLDAQNYKRKSIGKTKLFQLNKTSIKASCCLMIYIYISRTFTILNANVSKASEHKVESCRINSILISVKCIVKVKRFYNLSYYGDIE